MDGRPFRWTNHVLCDFGMIICVDLARYGAFRYIDLRIWEMCYNYNLTLQVPKTKKAELANSVVLDKVAHNEPPHLYLHCLPSSL